MQRIELTGLEQEVLSGFLGELLDDKNIDDDTIEVLSSISEKVNSDENWVEEEGNN